MHWELQGAFTGEVSAPMLLELGVAYVILGHSERRAYCDETDRTVNLKVKTALAQGLTPIVAVGETPEERDAGRTDERVTSQTLGALRGVPEEDLGRIASSPTNRSGRSAPARTAIQPKPTALWRRFATAIAGLRSRRSCTAAA